MTWLIKHAVGTGGASRALRRSGFGGGGPPPLSRALRRRRPLQNRSAVAPVSPPHDHRTWEEIVEQRLHVRHRLDRYGARRWLELVAALAEPPAYRPVATDGATRAAALMAELL